MKKIYQAVISKIDRSVSGSVIIVYMKILDLDKSFKFTSGQFVILNIRIGEQLLKRSYSIASTMKDYNDSSQLGFIIKLVPEGIMSTYFVNDAKIGDELEVIGPVGKMLCEETNQKMDYLLVSSGSGLGPIRSIYNSLKISNNFNKIGNIFGEKTYDDMVINFESESSANIQNIITFSREHRAGFYQGYVQKYILKVLSDLNKTLLKVYICGKPIMVDEVLQILEYEGVNREFIYFEKY